MPEKITRTLDEFWTVELGDLKSPDLEPQVKVSVWANECNFSLRLAHAGNMEQVGEFYQFTSADVSATIDANGIRLRLDAKPNTNQIVYTIRTKNVEFHKQPAGVWMDPGFIDPQGNVATEAFWMPLEPHVVNSFAVMHAGGKVGGQYRAGKAFHLFPPKCTDANGAEVFCDWDVDLVAETLTVTIPQSFLDAAAYPVEVD